MNTYYFTFITITRENIIQYKKIRKTFYFVPMQSGKEIIGFASISTVASDIVDIPYSYGTVNDFYISPKHRRKGYGMDFVEAYASVNNKKSIGILEKFGLVNIGLNKNGRSYHFKGRFSDLIKWYENK